jgi:hypothetical protein
MMLSNMKPESSRPFASRRSLVRAFSLIEVLFAVFILALGLLGLGAMIPVVIREQKQSADATMGLIVANSAETYLKNRPDLNRRFDHMNTGMGWRVLTNYPQVLSKDFSWEPSPSVFKTNVTGPDAGDEPVRTYFNVTTGRVRIQLETNATSTPCFIRVRDRLWPDASVGGVQPRFVWDFAPRRVIDVPGQPEQLQIAIFVRRIDPNIRVPEGFTLYQVLTQAPGLQESQWRRPVSVIGNVQPGNRRPTLDGVGPYAKPFVAAVTYNDAYPDRLQLDPAEVLLTWQLFSQPGQKLVDNIGNVYTVMSVVPNPGDDPALEHVVKIQPPVEPWVGATVAPGNPPGLGAPLSAWAEYHRKCSTLRKVVLTPQVPAAVTVFNVNVQNGDESPSGSGTGNVSP